MTPKGKDSIQPDVPLCPRGMPVLRSASQAEEKGSEENEQISLPTWSFRSA